MRHWFAEPILLWALAALPVLGLLALWARQRRRRALAELGGGDAFRAAITRRRHQGPWLFLLLGFGLALAAVGAAGPQWGRDWSQTATRGRDLVIVLDMSRSMLAESKTRFTRAQEAALNLAGEVRKRGGHRLGLVVFAGHARVVCPLTHDYDHFAEVVNSLDGDHLDPLLWAEENAVSGTRIGEALVLAVEAHGDAAHGVQDILLLSDGDDPAGDEEWQRGIDAAQERKLPIHTVGIGDPRTPHTIPFKEDDQVGPLHHDGDKVMTKLEEKPLREIARRTGGRYTPLGTSDYPLGELYVAWTAGGEEREAGVDTLPVYRQQAVWFFLPAFALLAATFFVGDLRRSRRGEEC